MQPDQREYLRHWGERFGHYGIRVPQPLIWLHVVSVGETRASAPLVRALRQRYPGHRILLTHATPTGRASGEQLFGAEVSRCYLPYDYPFAVKRFLEHFRPSLGLLLETELWPNLIHACREQGVPVCLVNGRLSRRSARRYARVPCLARPALRLLDRVAVQTRDDARRFKVLGAERVAVMGNLKFDVTPPPEALDRGRGLRASIGAHRPVFLAASTREGEEALVLRALERVHLPGLLLLLVPRHPQRFEEVAQLLELHGIPYQRRSAGESVDEGIRVLLGDTMGEMFVYYGACDAALIGGSLLPYGGQNLIEACAMGVPVLVGPHTFNFSDATRGAVAAGAALRVADAGELAARLTELLARPSLARYMGEAGLEFSRLHRGATQRVMDLLEEVLPTPIAGDGAGTTSTSD